MSTSLFSTFTWLDMISLARQMSTAFANVKSASLSNLALTVSSLMPQTILSLLMNYAILHDVGINIL